MLVDCKDADMLENMSDQRDHGALKPRPIKRADRRKAGRKELSAEATERAREALSGLLSKYKNNRTALARALSVSPTAVFNITEKGGGVSRGTALAIARVAGISPSELLGEDDMRHVGPIMFPNLEACIAYHGLEKWPSAAIAAARAGAFSDDTSPAAWADRLDRITAALDAAATSRQN